MFKTVFTQEGSLRPLGQRCLGNLKNLVAVPESYVGSLSAQLSERSLFTCMYYMHASATSIEVTALCNVYRFFSVLLKLGKIKIAKYSSIHGEKSMGAVTILRLTRRNSTENNTDS